MANWAQIIQPSCFHPLLPPYLSLEQFLGFLQGSLPHTHVQLLPMALLNAGVKMFMGSWGMEAMLPIMLMFQI
jgi:hypothetical protein